MPSSESLESRLRLTGDVAGRQRTFLLVPGENRIGSMPTNDIVLKAPGVSRNHALLSVGRDEVTVIDLSSKNGTFVNGTEVLEAELVRGDEIAIGSVKLSLLEIDDEDAAMAFVVSERPRSSAEPPTEGETEVARPSGEHRGLWLDLLDRYLSCLGLGGEAALPSALGQVTRGLGADAAVLCEWKASEPPMVLAAWGQPHSPGDVAELAASIETEESSQPYQFGFHEHPSPVAWCLVRTHDETLGLLLSGYFDDMNNAEPLLRALLAAAVLVRPDRLPERRPPVDSDERLVFPEGHVVGGSARIRVMYRELETACKAVFPVLVLGETGAGKEHVAKILHLSSPRGRGPFVAVNCAAIPSELLEAELFGIRKGVATGVAERQGRFQTAEGGTLMLDEVGDMPLALQAKLLRVLEENEVAPVGGQTAPVDVRIVAATNADLLEKVGRGDFRRDLYYRLAGYVVRVPSLRERRDDVPVLIEHFLRRIAEESGRHVRGITLRAMRSLSSHDWPGNVRELIHEVRRLVYGCHDGEAVDLPLLSEHVLAAAGEPSGAVHAGESLDLSEQTASLERRLIREALERAEGNRSQAARLLGISRQGLGMKLERLGLDV